MKVTRYMVGIVMDTTSTSIRQLNNLNLSK